MTLENNSFVLPPASTAPGLGIYTADQVPSLTFQSGATINNVPIANILEGGEASPLVETSITTVGAGTLTAAALIGGQISRTGPTAAFTDTTDTAANIIAALPGAIIGQTFIIRIKNVTAYTQTLAGGSGVTISTATIIPPFSIGQYFATLTTLSAVTLTRTCTVAISEAAYINSLNPLTVSAVGNTTVSAAVFAAGGAIRASANAAFTDTTDTAANIIAACSSLIAVGAVTIFDYTNATSYVATLVGGSGVTMTSINIPAGNITQFQVLYTGAGALTLTPIGSVTVANTSLSLAGATSGQTIVAPAAVAASGTGNILTLPIITDTLVGRTTTDTLTNKTLTSPTINGGTIVNTARTGPAPVAVGSSLTITSASAGAPILLNTAGGSVATLPAATGSGTSYFFYITVTTTSNSHKILAASSSDFMVGIVTGENANTAKCFASPGATNHSIQMPFAGSQPSGGFIGDWFEFVDVGANLWTVQGMYQAGTTPTTPFSSATS